MWFWDNRNDAKGFVQNLAVTVDALQVVNLSTGRKLVWSLDVYVPCFGRKTGLWVRRKPLQLKMDWISVDCTLFFDRISRCNSLAFCRWRNCNFGWLRQSVTFSAWSSAGRPKQTASQSARQCCCFFVSKSRTLSANCLERKENRWRVNHFCCSRLSS